VLVLAAVVIASARQRIDELLARMHVENSSGHRAAAARDRSVDRSPSGRTERRGDRVLARAALARLLVGRLYSEGYREGDCNEQRDGATRHSVLLRYSGACPRI